MGKQMTRKELKTQERLKREGKPYKHTDEEILVYVKRNFDKIPDKFTKNFKGRWEEINSLSKAGKHEEALSLARIITQQAQVGHSNN